MLKHTPTCLIFFLQRQINRGVNRETATRRLNKVLEVQQEEGKREQTSH